MPGRPRHKLKGTKAPVKAPNAAEVQKLFGGAQRVSALQGLSSSRYRVADQSQFPVRQLEERPVNVHAGGFRFESFPGSLRKERDPNLWARCQRPARTTQRQPTGDHATLTYTVIDPHGKSISDDYSPDFEPREQDLIQIGDDWYRVVNRAYPTQPPYALVVVPSRPDYLDHLGTAPTSQKVTVQTDSETVEVTPRAPKKRAK